MENKVIFEITSLKKRDSCSALRQSERETAPLSPSFDPLDETQESSAEPRAVNKTVSLTAFKAEKSRQRLIDQLRRSGLLDLKHVNTEQKPIF